MDSTKDDAQTVTESVKESAEAEKQEVTELPTDEQVGSVTDAGIEDAVVGAAAPVAIETMEEAATEKLKPLDPEQVLQAAIEDTDTKSNVNKEEAVLGSPIELPKDDVQPSTTESVKESSIEKSDDSQMKSATESSKSVQSEGDFKNSFLLLLCVIKKIVQYSIFCCLF